MPTARRASPLNMTESEWARGAAASRARNGLPCGRVLTRAMSTGSVRRRFARWSVATLRSASTRARPSMATPSWPVWCDADAAGASSRSATPAPSTASHDTAAAVAGSTMASPVASPLVGCGWMMRLRPRSSRSSNRGRSRRRPKPTRRKRCAATRCATRWAGTLRRHAMPPIVPSVSMTQSICRAALRRRAPARRSVPAAACGFPRCGGTAPPACGRGRRSRSRRTTRRCR